MKRKRAVIIGGGLGGLAVALRLAAQGWSVTYVRQMLMNLRLSAWLEALIAASWMTAIDLVIDPLAANQLGYWRWVKSSAYYGIPLHNFAGWFVVSLIIFSPSVAVARPSGRA